MGDAPRKPPTMLVMDIGQPDSAIAAQLRLVRSPPPPPQLNGTHCVHNVEYHAGLVGLDVDGCRMRRQVNAAGTGQRHQYVAAQKEQKKRKRKRKQQSRSGDDGEIRVGPEYQADVLPASVWNRRTAAEAQNAATFGYDQVWDPVQYRAASANDDRIDTLLGGLEREYNLTTNLMEQLHRSGYNFETARTEYIRSTWNNSVNLPNRPQKLFQRHVKSLIAGSKEMKKAADLIGCSKETIIVNYYRWKGEKRDSQEYQRVKQARNEESSECHVCGDGGKLIVCDLCKKSYHFECHDPPVVGDMSKVDVWYCSHCQWSSPARLRRRMSGGSLSTAMSTSGSLGSCASKKRVAPKSPALSLWKKGSPKGIEGSTAVAFRSDTTPSLATPNGLVYVAHIPMTDHGLGIRIGRHKNHVFFKDYSRVDHEIGPVEKANVFLSSGDIVVAVDRIPCVSLSYEEVRDLLKSRPSGNNMKLLTMLHKKKSSEDDAPSQQMRVPETPPRLHSRKAASETQPHPTSQLTQASAQSRNVGCNTRPQPLNRRTHLSARDQEVAYQTASHPGASSIFQTTAHQPGQQLDIHLTVGVSQGDGNATVTASPDPWGPRDRLLIPNQLQQPHLSPAITPIPRGNEAINSVALSHIWSVFAPTDLASFFLRWGFSTVNHVMSAQPTQLSNMLATDQRMEMDQARDYIGTVRCQMKTWLLHGDDSR